MSIPPGSRICSLFAHQPPFVVSFSLPPDLHSAPRCPELSAQKHPNSSMQSTHPPHWRCLTRPRSKKPTTNRPTESTDKPSSSSSPLGVHVMPARQTVRLDIHFTPVPTHADGDYYISRFSARCRRRSRTRGTLEGSVDRWCGRQVGWSRLG